MFMTRVQDWNVLIKMGALHRAHMDHASRTLSDWNAKQNSETLSSLICLIIDTDVAARHTVREALLTYALRNFVEEDTTERGLSFLERKHVDVVLLGLSPDHAEGIAFTLAVRHGGYVINSGIPIIGISNGSHPGRERKLRAAGINEVVARPICPATLFKSIRRLTS